MRKKEKGLGTDWGREKSQTKNSQCVSKDQEIKTVELNTQKL